MGVQVAGACFHLSSQLSPSHAPAASSSAHTLASVFSSVCSYRHTATVVHGGERALASPFLGVGLARAPSLELRRGRDGSRRQERALRRAFSANLENFADGDDEDEEFVRKLQELALQLRREEQQQEEDIQAFQIIHSRIGDASSSSSSFCSDPKAILPPPPIPSPLSKRPELLVEPPWLPVQPEPPEWLNQLVPASVEKNANRVGLPLSLRIIKERKKRLEDSFQEAGESAWRCSVKRAFSSMVFMVRELQSYALQLREAIFYEDLRGILDRVQREMNSSFVWLFQQIFSGTPTLMVSVMLLLANFTVYSMGHNVALAAPSANPPPSHSAVTTLVHDDHHQQEQQQHPHRHNSGFDHSSVKTFSIGRTASVGGNGGGGGGKVKPVAGATDDGRSDESSSSHRTILPDGISKVPSKANAEEGGMRGADVDSTVVRVVEEEAERAWKGIMEEVQRVKASTMDEALIDPVTLRLLVAPVKVELEAEDSSDYLQTDLMYQQALLQEPDNTLFLANFAQFLYLVLRDHDRAEHYFKRAVAVEPADAEALSRYASFLWLARKDLTAAEETYLEAIAADPENTAHAANYAHFLWSTGGEDTCFPLDDATGA